MIPLSCGLGLFLIAAFSQVESLMWNLKPGGSTGFKSEYNVGSGGWGDNVRQWDTSAQVNPWSKNNGLFGSAWNFPTGNVKGGSYSVRCFDSRQCGTGECCQSQGYSGIGMCVYSGYAGCPDRPGNLGWFQRPGYPGNNKGGQITVMTQFGRPGTCPPQQQLQGQLQYCRRDEHCPNSQKCCYQQGNAVCRHPIFA